ncbi:MAG: hypothetical protein HC880_12265 [Bacteroidia bacterium]|nr:hypothetical protein [Bacteroidia bacterium]
MRIVIAVGLLILNLAVSLPAQDKFYKQFQGKIGDKPVRVALIKAPSRDNFFFNLRGQYHYRDSDQIIQLTNGTLDAVGNFYLEEGLYQLDSYTSNQKSFRRTGTFTGIYYTGTGKIEGIWQSISTGRSAAFELYEDYSNGSMPAEIVFNDLSYENAEIRFHYPVFKGKPGAEAINRYIREQGLGDMQEKMNEFIQQYRSARESGGMADIFESSHIVYIIYNAHDLLSLDYTLQPTPAVPTAFTRVNFITLICKPASCSSWMIC